MLGRAGVLRSTRVSPRLRHTREAVKAALADDFDTPAAVDAVMDLIHRGNGQLQARTKVAPAHGRGAFPRREGRDATLPPPGVAPRPPLTSGSCPVLHGTRPPRAGRSHTRTGSITCLLIQEVPPDPPVCSGELGGIRV